MCSDLQDIWHDTSVVDSKISLNLAATLVCGSLAVAFWPESWSAWSGGQIVLSSAMGLCSGLCALSAAGAWREDWLRQWRLRRLMEEGRQRYPARWATDEDFEKAGMFDPVGAPIGLTEDGRALFAPSKGRYKTVHRLITGTTGSAKSSAALTQAVMHVAFSSGGASVSMFDPKNGEIASQCVGPLLRAGIDVEIDDPMDFSGLPGLVSLNAFEPTIRAVREGKGYPLLEARRRSFTLEPEPSDSDRKNLHWRDGTRRISTWAILNLATHDPRECTPTGVALLLNDDLAFEEALARDALEDGLHGQLARQVLAFREHNPEHHADFLGTARERFLIFGEGGPLFGAGARATASHSDLKARKIVRFFVLPMKDAQVLAPYTILQQEAALHALDDAGDRTVHLMCDEFTNAPNRALVEQLTHLRSSKVEVTMACQTLNEVARRFGDKECKTIRSQSSFFQVMGVTDPDEAKRISETLGQEPVITRGMGEQSRAGGHSANYSISGKPLMTAGEILEMPPEQQLIFVDGLPPGRCRKLYQNEISPIGELLDPNRVEGGKLPPNPKVQIEYGELS